MGALSGLLTYLILFLKEGRVSLVLVIYPLVKINIDGFTEVNALSALSLLHLLVKSLFGGSDGRVTFEIHSDISKSLLSVLLELHKKTYD